MKTENHKRELFLVEMGGDKVLLYQPLMRTAAVINHQAANVVNRFLEDQQSGFSVEEKEILTDLKNAKLISDEPYNQPGFPQDYGFHPYEVTLFLTSRCNLRCRYCYAEGGTRSEELDWEICKAGIDFAIESSLETNRKDFLLGFHGSGEPTMAWDNMKRSVLYAHEQGEKNGLKAVIHTATNGVLNDEQRAFIVKYFSGVNVSFDGTEDIQNHNRPFANGQGSFDKVFESLKYFDQQNFNFAIRVTVSNTAVVRMKEIVEFLGNSLPALREIHIEPLWLCGRCLTTGETPPSPEDFIVNFRQATEAAKELGLSIKYSGARLHTITNRFCGAPGEGFSVLPGGAVTSCYEVCESDDPRAELFHYGKYNYDTKKFEFDQNKINRLRKLSVENIAFCKDCFCKWHCAGDCLSKALSTFSTDGHNGSVRCTINRELTLYQIKDMIEAIQ